jgi:hypothetical protein
MKGNCIVVSDKPRGRFLEGIITDTSLPGTIMEVVPGVATQGGKFSYRASTRAAGKDRLLAVLREDDLQGFPATQAYVANTRCFLYVPTPGEEVNVLTVVPGTGTGLVTTIGSYYECDGTGKATLETGSPQSTPWLCLEAAHDVAAGGTPVWMRRIA